LNVQTLAKLWPIQWLPGLAMSSKRQLLQMAVVRPSCERRLSGLIMLKDWLWLLNH
jgi:hypothetical protein